MELDKQERSSREEKNKVWICAEGIREFWKGEREMVRFFWLKILIFVTQRWENFWVLTRSQVRRGEWVVNGCEN